MTHYIFESVPGGLLIVNAPLAELQIRIKMTNAFYSPLRLPEWILPSKLIEPGYSVTYVECRLGDVTYIYGLNVEGVGLQLRMVAPLYQIGGDVNQDLIEEFQVWSLLDTPNIVVDHTLTLSRGVNKPYSKRIDQLALDAFQWVIGQHRLGLDGKGSHYVLRPPVTVDRPTGHLSHDYDLVKLLTRLTVTAKVIAVSDLELTVYDSKIECKLSGESEVIDLKLTTTELGLLWRLDVELNNAMRDLKHRHDTDATDYYGTVDAGQCQSTLNELGLDYVDPTLVTPPEVELSDTSVKKWDATQSGLEMNLYLAYEVDVKWLDIAALVGPALISQLKELLVSIEITDTAFKLEFVGQTLELVLVDPPNLRDRLIGFFVTPDPYVTQKFKTVMQYDLTKKFVCKHSAGFITRINNSYILVRDATRD